MQHEFPPGTFPSLASNHPLPASRPLAHSAFRIPHSAAGVQHLVKLCEKKLVEFLQDDPSNAAACAPFAAKCVFVHEMRLFPTPGCKTIQGNVALNDAPLACGLVSASKSS